MSNGSNESGNKVASISAMTLRGYIGKFSPVAFESKKDGKQYAGLTMFLDDDNGFANLAINLNISVEDAKKLGVFGYLAEHFAQDKPEGVRVEVKAGGLKFTTEAAAGKDSKPGFCRLSGWIRHIFIVPKSKEFSNSGGGSGENPFGNSGSGKSNDSPF